MDPNETLRSLRAIAKNVLKVEDALAGDGQFTAKQAEFLADLAIHTANLFEALDEWIAKGGFLPRDWTKKGSAK